MTLNELLEWHQKKADAAQRMGVSHMALAADHRELSGRWHSNMTVMHDKKASLYNRTAEFHTQAVLTLKELKS